MNYNSDFDLDLTHGQFFEEFAEKILRGATVEIKADSLHHKTGNIAIEYFSRGKPSGLSVTKADWWGFVLLDKDGEPDTMLYKRTDKLKELCKKYFREHKDRKKINSALKKGKSMIVRGGDNNTSKMLIIPPKYLL